MRSRSASRTSRTTTSRTARRRTTCCELRRAGEPAALAEPHEHLDVGRFDMERAARMSGARFGYWIGDTGAVWRSRSTGSRSTVWRAKGFVTVLPPVLVREEALIGTGAFPSDEGNVYELPADGLLPRRHGGDPARQPARGRDPGRGRAAAPLRRVLAVLPARGRSGRPRHARDDPGAPVQQGRAVRAHAHRRRRGTSTSCCSRTRRSSSASSGCRTGSSSCRPATSRAPRRRRTTSRSGSRARSATARRRRSRTRPTSSRGASGSAVRGEQGPSRCTC